LTLVIAAARKWIADGILRPDESLKVALILTCSVHGRTAFAVAFGSYLISTANGWAYNAHS
jgi:hypothetical protein